MALTIIERNVQLDLYDHDLTPSKIKAIALDSKTRYVGAEIHNGGQTYDVGQNTGVKLTIIRPDKTGVQITGETFQYTVGEGETVYGAYAELTQTALAISGTLQAQFMLTSGDQILRTEIFTIANGVALDVTVSEWAGEYQGYNLDELVQNVNTAVATVGEMEQDVSDLKSGMSELQDGGYVADAQKIQEKIDKYLDEHPEATTTVQDGAITKRKLDQSVKNSILQVENPLGSKYESDSVGDNITLATFNVLSANYWRWPVNPPCDTDEGLVKACRNIRIANPDVIGMNEIPDNPKYTPLKKLQMCGYSYAYFYGTPVNMQNSIFGNPIMVKDGYEIISAKGATYENYSTQQRCYSNVIMQAPNGKQLSVYETHLDPNEDKMRLQVEELKSAVSEDDTEYKVVMGDFNMNYGSQIYNDTIGNWLETANKNLPTFIANTNIIDHILYTPNMEVVDYGTVENSDASDHRLLWAKIKFI